MNRVVVCLSIGLSTLLGSTVGHAAVRTAESETNIVDAFAKTVKANAKLPAERVEKAAATVDALRTDEEGRSLAITEGLRELYPQYREALAALGEENLSVAQASLTTLSTSDDPYLAADAAYFLSRIHLVNEKYEDALPLLESLEKKYADKSLRTGEALFLKGVAEAQMLKRKEAIVSLQRYLDENPNAPERMKIGAWRQLEQLKLIEDGTLSDVQIRMDFSRRRLALEDTGDGTRGEQKKIVGMLEQLIKEAEEKECNCKGNGKGSGKGQKQGKAGEGEGDKAEGQSEQGGQKGGGSKGIDSNTVERLHRGGPQSPWSKLRDKDRDPVFNAIKEKFPDRYEQLIEQYYKSFQDESEG